jgi:hypothetical protein
MNQSIEDRIAQYTSERDTCQETKDRAHKRILELNSLIKKLHFAKRDLEEILEPEIKKSSMQDLQEITNNLK